MEIDPKYLELSFEEVGIRNSQKRLKSLIAEIAVHPLRKYQEELREKFDHDSQQFDYIEAIVMKRVANTIVYWARNKHDPMSPHIKNMMSDITNASKNDMTLEEFYLSEVKYALYSLSPALEFKVPEDYDPSADELEFALLELEETSQRTGILTTDETTVTPESNGKSYEAQVLDELEAMGVSNRKSNDDDLYDDDDYYGADDDYDDDDDYYDYEDEPEDDLVPSLAGTSALDSDFKNMTNLVSEEAALPREPEKPPTRSERPARTPAAAQRRASATANRQAEATAVQGSAIVTTEQGDVMEAPGENALAVDVVNVGAQQTWNLIYGLIGYTSEYIQHTMLPRWREHPEAFEKDRRFLYTTFIDTIRNTSGTQFVGGNFRFVDNDMTIDQLWEHYFRDLSKNVAPQLTAARLHNISNETWLQKNWQRLREQLKNVSIVWLLALAIALIFDGLTTYVSLDQTPMEGYMVLMFSVLITILFQVADQMVINYRKREFDAEAFSAKYKAQYLRIQQSLEGLDNTSDSFVQLSMERSKAHSNWKSAEDNRKMARRGRFWTARIADINVIVTAYGFAFMFLNSNEPLYALVEQIDFIFVKGAWASVDLSVFIMIGLAITVSFVVNTAQRTEVLGWSMRSLRQQEG